MAYDGDRPEGTAARNALRSQIERIVQHALTLAYSPAAEPRPGWMNSIDDARGRIEDTITPSIRRDLEAGLPRLFERARRKVERGLAACGEHEMAAALPRRCPYTLDELLAEDWHPENRYGLHEPVDPQV